MQFQLDFILPSSELNRQLCAKIPGLSYTPDFISGEQQDTIIKAIDQLTWENHYKRRTQYYGLPYLIPDKSKIPEFPNWLKELAKKLVYADHIQQLPDHAGINEYLPGQGIGLHIDQEMAGDTIVIVSLGSTILMDFEEVSTKRKSALLLEPGSLLILRGEARYNWKHGIASRLADKFNGISYARKRRVSITLRKTPLQA